MRSSVRYKTGKNKKRIENRKFAWYSCSFQEKVENSDAVV
jgi:hypothetical protein